MLAVMEVFGGVLVLGRIAAADVPALHAHAQVNPGVAHLYALRADVGVGAGELDLIEVMAFRGHCDLRESPGVSVNDAPRRELDSLEFFTIPVSQARSGLVG